MKCKKYNIFILFLFMEASLFAQYSIKGNVRDENNVGISNVTIRLLRNDSTYIKGTTTDSIGNYYLNDISAMQGYITHSCIGYKSIYTKFDFHKQHEYADSIILSNDVKTLNEVTVTASLFIRQKDCLLIIPDKKQTKHSYSGYDLLYNLMIPGVSVNKKSGEVFSFNEKVTLYIDGRKADYREIYNLRPRDIEKIEYYDLPTGKYSGDIASINYITKQHDIGGYVAMDTKQTVGYMDGAYNLSSKMAQGNTSYTLFAGYNREKDKGAQSDNTEHFHFPNTEIERMYYTTDAIHEADSRYMQLNIQNKNLYRTLWLKIAYVRNESPQEYHAYKLEYKGAGSQNSFKNSTHKGTMPSVNMYGKFHLKSNQFLEISLAGNYADNHYGYDYSEGENKISTATQEDMYGFNTNLNYGIQFKHQNSFTAKFYHLHKISQSSYTSSRQHLWTGESILFFEYSQRFKKRTSIKVTPGISSLQYKLHHHNRISQISPRLQCAVTHQPSPQHYFQMKVNIGNSFPTIDKLNLAEQEVDFLLMKRGNPDLKTTKAYHVTGVYAFNSQKISLQAVGMGQFYQDMCVDDYFVEHNRIVHSYRSDVNWRLIMGMLSLTYKVTDKLHIKTDGNYTFYDYYGGVNKCLNAWNGQLQLNYYHQNFLFNLYGKTTNRVLGNDFVETHLPINYGLSVNLNKKAWNIEVGMENLFSHHLHYTSRYTNSIYRFRNDMHSKKDEASGYVRIAYTFDFGRKTSRDAKDIDTTIRSAILKAE